MNNDIKALNKKIIQLHEQVSALESKISSLESKNAEKFDLIRTEQKLLKFIEEQNQANRKILISNIEKAIEVIGAVTEENTKQTKTTLENVIIKQTRFPLWASIVSSVIAGIITPVLIIFFISGASGVIDAWDQITQSNTVPIQQQAISNPS